MKPQAAKVFLLLSLVMLSLMAGLYFVFSSFIMSGLDNITPNQAIAAMQGINDAVRTLSFFVTFFLSPIVGAIAIVLCFSARYKSSAILMILAVAIYILGSIVITFVVNIPLNGNLAALQVNIMSSEAARNSWEVYSASWTGWNTVRALICSISVVLAGLALVKLGEDIQINQEISS